MSRHYDHDFDGVPSYSEFEEELEYDPEQDHEDWIRHMEYDPTLTADETSWIAEQQAEGVPAHLMTDKWDGGDE